MSLGVSCTASALPPASATENAPRVPIRKSLIEISFHPYAQIAHEPASGFPQFHASASMQAGTVLGRSMSKIHRIAAALALLAAPAHAAQKAHAIANLKTRDGKQAGQVDFASVNRGVLIT